MYSRQKDRRLTLKGKNWVKFLLPTYLGIELLKEFVS